MCIRDRDITVKNNIFDKHGKPGPIFYQLGGGSDEDYNMANPDFGAYSEGANSIEDYAEFADTAASDFRLKITSPAINEGVSVGLTRDIRNYIIPQGSAPDMGAYERIVDKVLKFPGNRDMWLEFPGNRKFVIKK